MNKLLSIVAFALVCVTSFAVPAFAQTAATPSCAAGDPVVWENTSSKSKVYHMQGDSYYGKTKHGTYACKSAADSAGYHASGSKTSTAPDAMTSPAPAASASAKHHHKHHSKSASASPAPSPAAT
jgi:hypothetical protein